MIDPKNAIRLLRKTFRKKAAKRLLTDYWLEKNVQEGIHSVGFCYIATEALFHLVGGTSSDFRPMYLRDGAETHWWLQDSNGSILDPTHDQYGGAKPPYHLGKRAGFQNGYKRASKRASALLALI